MGTGDSCNKFGNASAGSRKTNAPSRGQRLHQHLPALSRLLHTADNLIHGNNHIPTCDRRVVKRNTHWVMSFTENDSWSVGGNQGAGDANLFTFTQ